MKHKTIQITLILILCTILFRPGAYAQAFQEGAPLTIHRVPDHRAFENTLELPELDNTVLGSYADSIAGTLDCKSCKTNFYGKGIDLSIDIKTHGKLETLSNNGRLWLLPIHSASAYGMQFYFNKFRLPFGATLFFYNEDRTMILGAFTSDNNNPDPTQAIQFGTQWIAGNTIYIEYYEPADAEFEGALEINTVIHIYSDVIFRSGPFSSGPIGPCHVNVSCQASGWEKEINSVALILRYNYNNKLSNVCSGAMINNTANDGRPYFLTAKHCVGNSQDPFYNNTTWLFLFNHQSKTCTSDGSDVFPSTIQSVYGSQVLADDSYPNFISDYALLELNTTKPTLEKYGVCYAGWDRTNSAGSPPFVGIHHPRGDIKKISIENSMVISTEAQLNVINPNFNFWRVIDWEKGVTDVGSSGSPLFNGNHRLIGQLCCGLSECNGPNSDNGQSDWYGKFSKSWTLGGFSFWLDPTAKGDNFVDTYCPSTCTDGIQNGSETGIDCGGNCPPCATGSGSGCTAVQHTINGRSTINANFINVCKSSIVLSPYGYTTCQSSALWNVTKIEQKVGNNKPCALAGTPPGIPTGCSTRFTPLPNCFCSYDRLFLGIHECDENKNLVGTGYSHWFDYNSNLSGQSIFKQFKLLDYLPPGASIQEGKNYAIKTATSKNGWKEHTSFIRVYTDNLLIQNKTIGLHQFANTITIQNAIVPAAANIKMVAKTRIELLPNTTLESGSYYIDTFDCTSLDQFKQ